jgi:preprotein translocase subunit YajC
VTQQEITYILYGLFIVAIGWIAFSSRRKRDKAEKALMGGLKRGDKVLTNGGIYGKVSKIKENSVLIKVNDDTEIEFIKTAIIEKVE